MSLTTLFVSSTAWAHKAINAVVLVQTGTLCAMAPFTTAIPNSTAVIVAGGAAVLFGVLRTYETRLVLKLELEGNGKRVRVETASFYGGTSRRTIETKRFLSTNPTWPPQGNKWWMAARFVSDKEGHPHEMLLFETGPENVKNKTLFNKMLVGQLQ